MLCGCGAVAVPATCRWGAETRGAAVPRAALAGDGGRKILSRPPAPPWRVKKALGGALPLSPVLFWLFFAMAKAKTAVLGQGLEVPEGVSPIPPVIPTPRLPTVVLVVVFGICWAPFHTDRLVWSFISTWTSHMLHMFQYVHIISGVFFYLSSAANPILYNLMSTRFREMFKEVMCHPGHSPPWSRKYSPSVTHATTRSTECEPMPSANGLPFSYAEEYELEEVEAGQATTHTTSLC